jgi:hypothetical protein
VSDGTHTTNLDFNGNYQLANFKFASDDQGGTTVYDPPVTTSTTTAGKESTDDAGSKPVTNATQHTDTAWGNIAGGSSGNDAFVFKPNFAHDAVTNFKPSTDVIQTDHALFQDLQHLVDTAHHDAGTNAAIPTDSGSGNTLHDMFKNQSLQHLSDFHFV